MAQQQLTKSDLVDLIKKKTRQTQEDTQTYKEDCYDLQHKLQVEITKADAISAQKEDLSRRVQLLEQQLQESETQVESTETKLTEMTNKAAGSERIRKTLQNNCDIEDDFVSNLEAQLLQAKVTAEDADKKYEEAGKKLVSTEQELEVAEKRAEEATRKMLNLEDQLNSVGKSLRSLEMSKELAGLREDQFKGQLAVAGARLRQAEDRAELAEKMVQKLQVDVDKLEANLVKERERLKRQNLFIK